MRAVPNLPQAGDATVSLAAIVEDSDDAIISTTLDGVVTSWNRAAEALFGYAAAEVVGRPVAILDAPGREDEMLALLGRVRSGEVLRFEGWTLEPGRRRVTGSDGQEVPLTTGEFDLLQAFVNHAGRVLERDQLMDLVKGREWAAYDRSIDQQVARLRRKIEPDPANPSLIKSVRGVGYLFAAAVRRG